MRKLLTTILLCTLVFSCSLDPASTDSRVVVNSSWERVSVPSARALSAKGIDTDYIAEYNATHTDDQLFVYESEEDVPSIEESPDVDIFVVCPETHATWSSFDAVPREEFVANRAAYNLQCELDALANDHYNEFGQLVPGTLYVDNVPEPEVVTPEDPYVKYALYIVYDADGIEAAEDIIFEEHPTASTYLGRLRGFQLEVELHNTFDDPAHPWAVVNGRIYPAVVEPEPEE